VLTRVAPIALIVILGLVFFAPLVVQPSAVLYSDYSDFINYHIPCKYFLVRSWQQTGELPLWCPEMFSGMPFVHDAQVAAFYPPHLPLYFLPPDHIGAACSWLIVLHVIAAGLCMYAYARYKGLTGAGALVAALGYMFAGKWLMHLLVAGHFNAAPLAWLPLVLLFLEQAIERGSFVRASAAGVMFAFIVLGTHPQFTFYAGMFVALWTLATALCRVRSRDELQVAAESKSEGSESPLNGPSDTAIQSKDRETGIQTLKVDPGRQLELSRPEAPSVIRKWPVIRRWLLCGIWTALVAGLLSAVQILPSLEATGLSSRSLGVPRPWEDVKMEIQLTLVGVVGPPLINESSWFWENRGGLGLVWLAVAACAPVLVPRREVRVQAVITVLWIFLGLGGVLLLQWVPGFHLWRLPSRMLIITPLPLALLAGTTVQALLAASPVSQETRNRCRNLLVKLPLFVLIPLGLYAFLLYQQKYTMRLAPYWLSLLLTLPLAWWLIGKEPAENRSLIVGGWVAVLLADLWALGFPLVAVHSEADLFAPSASVRYLADHAEERGRVLDICRVNWQNLDDHDAGSATPMWPNFAMMTGIEQVRGYNPLDYLRYKEYLQFVMNRDGALRAVENLTLPGPVIYPPDKQPLSGRLLELLGVRYLLLPKDMPIDWFVDGGGGQPKWSKVFEDPNPRAYSFVPTSAARNDAGILALPPYVVYENRNVLPRAFVVHEAARLPSDGVLNTLKNTDFRRMVLLSGSAPVSSGPAPDVDVDSEVTIEKYEPNQVTIQTKTSRPGWLVLADPWYPGWFCITDGSDKTPIYQANYLYRAVELPAGTHQVEFRFRPQSYVGGRTISIVFAIVLLAALLFIGASRWIRRLPKSL
jgi:hypothetical protein